MNMKTQEKSEATAAEAASTAGQGAGSSTDDVIDSLDWETISTPDDGDSNEEGTADAASTDEGTPPEQAAEATPPAADGKGKEGKETETPAEQGTTTEPATETKPDAAKAEVKEPEDKKEVVAPPAEEIPQVSREEWLNGILPQLEERYKLSEEDAADAMTDPGKVFPKLAANLHVAVFESIVNAIGSQLPQVLTNIQMQQKGEEEATSEFMKAWPELNDDEGIALATRLVPVYRQANPGATREQVIREVGASAMMALRRQKQGTVETSPDTSGQNRVEIPAGPAPHTPAGRGSLPPSIPSVGADNEFTKIAEEMIADDQA